MTGPHPRHACVLLVAVILALAGGGSPSAALGQSCLCGTAADDLVAARLGLEREWVVQVPFDSAAWRLEHVVVGDSLVVAQGGDGSVAAISTTSAPGNPRRGTVAWAHHLGTGTAPIEAAGIGPGLVTVARGRELVALDAATGEVCWERPLRAVASAAAVPSAGWVYAPLDPAGIQRFPDDPLAKPAAPAEADADGKPATTPAEPAEGPRPGESLAPIDISSDGEVDSPPLAFRGGIVWCSADGRMAALVQTTNASDRLEFDLGGPAAGPLVVHDNDIFVATKAGDIARITRSPRGLTANSGVMTVQGADEKPVTVNYTGWHTVIDEIPEGSPVVGGDTVVVSLGPAGVAAFDAATGGLLWQEPALGRPVAITGDQVWCLEATGFLVARDLATGARLGRLCLGCFTIPIVNTTSERLVLASPGGLVVSLAPRRTVAAEPPVPQPPAPQPSVPAEGADADADAAEDL
ncbi:MAG: PQQ-binding-like beta-propeller repeat protein [Planctomycetota bacterium]